MNTFHLKNILPSDIDSAELMAERDILIREINGGHNIYSNYAAIVSRFNLVCNELHKRNLI